MSFTPTTLDDLNPGDHILVTDTDGLICDGWYRGLERNDGRWEIKILMAVWERPGCLMIAASTAPTYIEPGHIRRIERMEG